MPFRPAALLRPPSRLETPVAHLPFLSLAPHRRVISFDRPPFGLAERPLSWGGPGQALSYNPYTLDGAARLTAGA